MAHISWPTHRKGPRLYDRYYGREVWAARSAKQKGVADLSNITVLVADDDANVCELVELYLGRDGIHVRRVNDGKQALEMVSALRPDLVILDVMMPELDGFSVCKEIRRHSDVPVMMLTAREEEVDRVLGLELGADDYLTKPFSPRELAARVKAILRRVQAPRSQASPAPEPAIAVPGLRVDVAARAVYAGAELVSLTPKEFDLLVLLMRHPRQVLTREQILSRVWGYEFIGDARNVDVHVKKLRQKLGQPAQGYLFTVWGVGYKWEVTPDAEG